MYLTCVWAFDVHPVADRRRRPDVIRGHVERIGTVGAGDARVLRLWDKVQAMADGLHRWQSGYRRDGWHVRL